MKNSHEQFFGKFTIKSKNGKNGQKWPKSGRKWAKAFFLEIFFLLFFVTYQGLTHCKKSKKSNERILRSGERTEGRKEGRTDGITKANL